MMKVRATSGTRDRGVDLGERLPLMTQCGMKQRPGSRAVAAALLPNVSRRVQQGQSLCCAADCVQNQGHLGDETTDERNGFEDSECRIELLLVPERARDTG